MKKALSVILALLLLASVLCVVGCTPEQPSTTDKTPLGPYEPTLKLTFAFPYHGCNAETFSKYDWTEEDNGWTRLIRRKLNIKLELKWNIFDPAAYFEKLDSSIFVNDLPEIINCNIGENWAYDYLKRLNQQDLLADLTEAYDYLDDSVKASYQVAGKEVFYPCTFDGVLKGLPQVYYSPETANNVYWIRQDWLDNVGLKAPTNYEELKAVIKAFSVADPDMDGEQNTYGFALCVTPDNYDRLLFAGYNAYPYIWIENDDGELVYGSVQPEMKTALAELSDMYKSGYIDPYLDGNRYTDCINGTCGMLSEWFGYILNLDDRMKYNASMDWTAIRGFGFGYDDDFRTLVGQFGYRYYAVNKSCKYPEALCKMMNLYAATLAESKSDKELFETLFEDPDGVHHIRNTAPVMAGVLTEKTELLCVRIIEALETGDISSLTDTTAKMTYDKCLDYQQNGTLENYPYYKMYGPGGSLAEIAKYDASEYITNLFATAQTETMAKSWNELLQLEFSTYSGIINGTMTIDEFDMFVTTWKEMGGEEITKEVNEWYKSVQQ